MTTWSILSVVRPASLIACSKGPLQASVKSAVNSWNLEKVEEALASLKTSISGSDVAAIKTATESLMTASQGFSQRLYEEASKSAQAEGEATSAQDDEIVDAEIVDEPKGE